MKLYKAFLISITFSFTILSGCESTSVVECAKKWVLYNYQNVGIGFNDGAMAVVSNSLNNGSPTTFLYNDTISGDFEMILEYEDLFVNSPGLGFRLTLTGNALNQGNGNYFSAQIGTTLYPGLVPQGVFHIGAFIDSIGNSPSASNGNTMQATNSFGELRFRRVGSTVEVISKTGTTVAIYSKEFYTAPIVFGITYGSNYPNTPQYSSSVRITNFRYFQNTTLVDGDAFDCNSLQ